MKKDYILMLFLKRIESFGSKFLYALCISVFLIGTLQIYAETKSSIIDLNERTIVKEDPVEIFTNSTSHIGNLSNNKDSNEIDNTSEEQPLSNSTCISVSSAEDDAEEFEDGFTFIDSSDLELVHDNDYPGTGHRGNQTVGIRFNSVDIPQGATITNAYIQFTVDENVNSNETVNVDPSKLIIFGEAVDNATAFLAQSNDITLREKTEANVAWSPALWTTPGAQSSDQQTVDISSIIQEIVNRDGYSIYNSIAIIITGTGRRTAASYDGSPSQAPQLCIEYSNGGADDPCIFGDLLNYNIIAEKRIGLNYNSTVCDGGVGTIDNYGVVRVRYNSHVEGFVKSPNIWVNYNSSVGSKIYDNVDLPLPEFVHNTVSDSNSQDIVVNYGQTVTLDGYNYGRIEVKGGATVIFTKSNVFIDELVTRYKGKVEFIQSSNLFIKKSVVFGRKTKFNHGGDFSVVMYVEEDVTARPGSNVDAYIYALNNIVVKGRYYNRTMMNGLFIGKRIRAVSYVSWCTGATCSTAEIVIPNSSTSVAARGGVVNKGTDAIVTQVINSELIVDFGAKTWPNPSKNDFNIRITTDNKLDEVNIQVMDITGKQVHLNTFASDQSYKFGSNLQSGVYIVKVSQAENNKTLRVVKY